MRVLCFFFFKEKTAYEMRISDWSSDVCSSDLLTTLMGGDLGPDASELSLAAQPPAVILMAGLQGAGKTTTSGKLAKWLNEGGHVQHGRKTGRKKVLLVSADVYRPAAIDQLKTVAAQEIGRAHV